jgi:hypothetical protein
MGGAALTSDVGHLLLYEPSLWLSYPTGSIEAVEQALAAGDREAAIRLVVGGIFEMSEEAVEEMRGSPLWPVRLASAPTVPRECLLGEGGTYRPGRFDGVTAPTLVPTGPRRLPRGGRYCIVPRRPSRALRSRSL